jgi:hypothetical protein
VFAGTRPTIFIDELVLKGLPRRADGIRSSRRGLTPEARGLDVSNTVEFSKTALLADEKSPRLAPEASKNKELRVVSDALSRRSSCRRDRDLHSPPVRAAEE